MNPEFPKKRKRVRKRATKSKPKEDKITLVQKDSNGSSNWDQLAKVLGYEAKHVRGPTELEKMENLCIQMSQNDRLSANGKPGHSRKSALCDIKDMGNFLPSSEKPITNGIHKATNSGVLSKHSDSMRSSRHVAMDCEMVGTGLNGVESMIARVSIVNRYNDCIYDTYVKPKDTITDYRTPVSGIRPSNLVNAKDLLTVQKEVLEILEGKILIGHALKNDLNVLFISHPRAMLRDTSRYRPFRQLFDGRTPSLKKLTLKVLGEEIQSGEHSSIEDAQAAMQLYLMHRRDWEKSLKKKWKKHYRKRPKTEMQDSE